MATNINDHIASDNPTCVRACSLILIYVLTQILTYLPRFTQIIYVGYNVGIGRRYRILEGQGRS